MIIKPLKVRGKYATNHYDINLEGLCWVDGYRYPLFFEVMYETFDATKGPAMYKLYELPRPVVLREMYWMRKFKTMVGGSSWDYRVPGMALFRAHKGPFSKKYWKIKDALPSFWEGKDDLKKYGKFVGYTELYWYEQQRPRRVHKRRGGNIRITRKLVTDRGYEL